MTLQAAYNIKTYHVKDRLVTNELQRTLYMPEKMSALHVICGRSYTEKKERFNCKLKI